MKNLASLENKISSFLFFSLLLHHQIYLRDIWRRKESSSFFIDLRRKEEEEKPWRVSVVLSPLSHQSLSFHTLLGKEEAPCLLSPSSLDGWLTDAKRRRERENTLLPLFFFFHIAQRVRSQGPVTRSHLLSPSLSLLDPRPEPREEMERGNGCGNASSPHIMRAVKSQTREKGSYIQSLKQPSQKGITAFFARKEGRKEGGILQTPFRANKTDISIPLLL